MSRHFRLRRSECQRPRLRSRPSGRRRCPQRPLRREPAPDRERVDGEAEEGDGEHAGKAWHLHTSVSSPSGASLSRGPRGQTPIRDTFGTHLRIVSVLGTKNPAWSGAFRRASSKKSCEFQKSATSPQIKPFCGGLAPRKSRPTPSAQRLSQSPSSETAPPIR